MTAPLPTNLATGDLIAEAWMDAVVACLAELQPTLPGPWTAPTLLNSWTAWSPGSAQVPQYRKHGDLVEVRGDVKGGTVPSPIFNLPVGFRPPGQISVATAMGTDTGYLVITTGGDVSFPSMGIPNGHIAMCFSFSTVA